MHCRTRPERVANLKDMLSGLHAPTVEIRVFDDDKGEESWRTFQHTIARKQWQWAVDTEEPYCVFMSDDLAVAPMFWRILRKMTIARPTSVIGLLSNHPAGPALAEKGYHWYRTNSWIVGPAYLMPRPLLLDFLRWYDAQKPDEIAPFNDDSIINEWVSRAGPGETYHPLPTIIEHLDIESTWCPGDQFSKQRLSWRAEFSPIDTGKGFAWAETARKFDGLNEREFWTGDAPMLQVAGASASEAERWPAV
jgi:hypothetical protein